LINDEQRYEVDVVRQKGWISNIVPSLLCRRRDKRDEAHDTKRIA
jgi:hypothetical protein